MLVDCNAPNQLYKRDNNILSKTELNIYHNNLKYYNNLLIYNYYINGLY